MAVTHTTLIALATLVVVSAKPEDACGASSMIQRTQSRTTHKVTLQNEHCVGTAPSCPAEEHGNCCSCLSDEWENGEGDWDNGFCCGHCNVCCEATPAPTPRVRGYICNERISDDGAGYRGCQTETLSARTCMAWDAQNPHAHTRTPANYPESGLEENKCRNPDGEPTIWCYTMDEDARWEYCERMAREEVLAGPQDEEESEDLKKEYEMMGTNMHCSDDSPGVYLGMCGHDITLEECQHTCDETEGCKFVSWVPTSDDYDSDYGNMYTECTVQPHMGRDVYSQTDEEETEDLRGFWAEETLLPLSGVPWDEERQAYDFSDDVYADLDSTYFQWGTSDFTLKATITPKSDTVGVGGRDYATLFVKSEEYDDPYTGPTVFLNDDGTVRFRLSRTPELGKDNLVTLLDGWKADVPVDLTFIRQGDQLFVYQGTQRLGNGYTVTPNHDVNNSAPFRIGANHEDATDQNMNVYVSGLRSYKSAVFPEESSEASQQEGDYLDGFGTKIR